MDNVEVWKDIQHYEGLYQVSNLGRVWSVKSNRIIGDTKVGKGNDYKRVKLCNKYGKQRGEYIHRLVALTFIPNPNNYTFVHHKDENKINNNVDNLEWLSLEMHNAEHKTGKPSWNKGIPMSDEARKKLSESKKGKPAPNKGMKCSDETKKKISISNKGKTPWNKCKKLKEK